MKKIILIILIAFMGSPLFASGNFSLWAGRSLLINNFYKDLIGTWTMEVFPEYNYTVVFQGAYWYYTWWGIGGKASLIKSWDERVQTSMFSLTAGVPLLADKDPFGFGLDLYAGYGYCFGKAGGVGISGGNFIAEADLKVSYYFIPSLSLDVKLGCRYTPDIEMTANETSESLGHVDKGGRVVTMNLSGFTFGAGVNYRFSSKYWPKYDER